jgi:3-deoxy-D-manno-octulosonic acid (KDO) 8-phosphate synthase
MTNSAKQFKVGDIEIGNGLPFSVLAGPCQIEGLDHTLYMAEKIALIRPIVHLFRPSAGWELMKVWKS